MRLIRVSPEAELGEQFGFPGANWGKTAAMNGARPMPPQASEVVGRCIAFVPVEAKFRPRGRVGMHEAIAGDLGDHARRRDAEAEAVSADQRGVRNREGANGQSVDQGVDGGGGKRGDGLAHGLVGGSENVQPVDNLGLNDGDGPDDARRAGEALVVGVASPGAQTFRIVEALAIEIRRQDDGCGDHWTGEWATAGFIDAGDGMAALRL